MPFPTIRFAAFFVVVLVLAWSVARRPLIWKLVLLGAGVSFAVAWDVRSAGILAGSLGATQWFAVRIASARSPATKRWFLWSGVAANLVALGWFKYAGFFAESLTGLLTRLGMHVDPPVIDIALPVGLSFLTFRSISYLVEVSRGTIGPGTLLDVAVWQTFFPQLVAGPIVRPSEFLPQLQVAPDRRRVDASRALWLIARGLFKKVVLASFLATALADRAFSTPGDLSSPEVLVGIYAYATQIYVDFSGYTDMAIGFALLLGIRLPENFDRPYRSASIREFWTRWHITLSRWLRDFLFTPLALRARGSRLRVYRSLILVMLLAGLWHGAAWTFVAFGAVHGVALAVERWRRDRRRAGHRPAPPDTPVRMALRRILTFQIICLGWVFFRAESLEAARRILARLFTAWGDGAPGVTPLLVLVLGAVIGAQFLPEGAAERMRTAFARAPALAQAAALASVFVVLDVFGPEGVPPFIYFRF